MKKKLLGLTALAATLTLSTGITTFAGWVQEGEKWAYQYDNGKWAACGWFTDPADGAQYYLDPDGYMMTDTRVEGFRLGPDGKKMEKTAEEIQAEEERKQRIASRPSPAKEQAAAELAAKAAKKGTAAVSTTRLAYQAEMKTFMDTIFINTAKSLDNNKINTIKGQTVEDNVEVTYRFHAQDRGHVITSSLWPNSNEKSPNYVPQALDLTFSRSILTNEKEASIFNGAFQKMLVAALGDTEGQIVYERIMAETVGNGARFELLGNTDVGNSYTLNYRDGYVQLQVVCSEFVPQEASETTGETADEAADTAAAAEPAPTTSVIVAGQGQAAAQETAADTASAEETETTGSAEATDSVGTADATQTAEAGETAAAAETSETTVATETAGAEETAAAQETAATEETTAVTE